MPNHVSPSIEAEEIARFSSHASAWWEPNGPLRPLHRLNPARIVYVRDRIAEHFQRETGGRRPLAGLSVLDVGCGGGLLAEPMARLGADVTGLDASAEAIAEAKRHAKECRVKINYVEGSAEKLADGAMRYDVITALEIVEHVADLDVFVAALAKLLKPKGLLILSTVNRTTKSFLLGIVAAEYLLRWVPLGTHSWNKFLRPSELVRKLDSEALTTTDLTGITYHPLTGEYTLCKDNLNINYMLTAVLKG
jgi:2-polyprenyl-6-hydroxyphenyl methylase/3-demethylubiquinone-9 3-methyltransferase